METLYPMRFVAKTTGLSPHVIRVWEKRYGALRPGRSSTNRRLFSESEVARLRSLAKLTHYGHSISQLASLSDKDLRDLERELPNDSLPTAAPQAQIAWDLEECLGLCLQKISDWDGAGLEAVLRRASVEFSAQTLIEKIVAPMLEEIGRRWESGEFRVAHEHLATAALRSFLGGLQPAYPEAMEGPLLVVATPAGQVHELGALLVAKTASNDGFKVLYLGSNLPAEEIAAAVKQQNAQCLALSLLFPAEEAKLFSELERLSRLLPSDFRWVCGGRAARLYQEKLRSLGCEVLSSLADFRAWLREWGERGAQGINTPSMK